MVDDERARQIALAVRLRAALTEQKAQQDKRQSSSTEEEQEEDDPMEQFEDLGIADAASRSGSDSSPPQISRASTARWSSIDPMGLSTTLDNSEADIRRDSRASRKSRSSRTKSTSRSRTRCAPAEPTLQRLTPSRTATTPYKNCNPDACPVKIVARARSAPRAASVACSEELEPLEEALVVCRDPVEYETMRVQLLKHFLTEDELRRRQETLRAKYPNICYRPAPSKKDKKAQTLAHPEPLRKLTEAEIMRLVASPRGRDCVKELKQRREAKKWRELNLSTEVNWRPSRVRPVDLDDLCLSPVDPIPDQFKEEARRRVEEIQAAMREMDLRAHSARPGSSSSHNVRSASSSRSGKKKASH